MVQPRIVTATALFDGHDAAINLVRRLLVSAGAQVIHLGHNRSVAEIVKAAVEEDADGVCISSYQGGHTAFFPFLVQSLEAAGAGRVRVFGGGGGVIIPEEATALEAQGVAKIYTPDDGLRLGVEGMIADLLGRLEPRLESARVTPDWKDRRHLSQALTVALEDVAAQGDLPVPVIGLTGTGGAGKSSLTDELLLRFLEDQPSLRIAVLALDPTRRKSGGALLGDRLRMNSAGDARIFFRSLAIGEGQDPVPTVRRAATLLGQAGADLVVVETPGIGQGDTAIIRMCHVPIYVMTREFGAATQLEKISMLDDAALVVLNKFEDAPSVDALAAVRRQVRRNRALPHDLPDEQVPVFGTCAGRFRDPGVDRLYRALLPLLAPLGLDLGTALPDPGAAAFTPASPILPPERSRYLQAIVQSVRGHHSRTEDLAKRADLAQAHATLQTGTWPDPDVTNAVAAWEDLKTRYGGESASYVVRGHRVDVPMCTTTLSGTKVPKVALPRTDRWSEAVRFLRLENVPGAYPFTAGVFPFRRTDEDPKRQFAGEGGPERTNRRFHFLCHGEKAHRLSTAFDSVTLYGEDPAERPDIFGKVGESGVSIATLDDMKTLFAGFDLLAPSTSVSMTINGPAPVILAMFFNTVIDQATDHWKRDTGREDVPEGIAAKLREEALCAVRGTVQADILKEDQAQNTCIFSVPFALRLMGDVQDFLVRHRMRNYYGVSISGYHIAEAGADPITQLAFTLANGFTLLEYYLSRGMTVEQVSPNLSFFFSSGLDPEYAVLGRVARRIWAIALKEVYGAPEACQKLKYHVQTSGRSLHLREMKFNDIRTTLQALTALTDNCNSLHTNAYDEAITTPTEESVRLAMAIQRILTQEFGLYRSENLWQGSYFLEQLTDAVEHAVLEEFLALDARGGVLKAMEHQYQRLKIQEQSLHYERLKHDGTLPVVGVNTFVAEGEPEPTSHAELSRATDAEKAARLDQLQAFQSAHAEAAPAVLERLRQTVREGGNAFDVLMDAVRVASLGQITQVLFELGGRYRRGV